MSSSMSLASPKEREIEALSERKIMLLWSFTVWLVVMNTTMFNVALPTVLIDLSLTSTTVSWIVSGYSIAFAISSLAFSRLSDFLPISRLLLIGLLLFGFASIIGFFADQFALLLLARVLQATGAGAVPGLAMVLAGRYIPVSRRGRAMALIASAASLGFGLGPVAGGAITQYLGWNYLFGISMLVVLFIPLFQRLLPKEEVHKGKFDVLGAGLTILAITGLLLSFSLLSLWMVISTVVLFICLWVHLYKTDIPFIQPELFKEGPFLKLLFIAFAAFMTHFSTLFLIPLILTNVYSKGAAEVGFIIFPGAILSALTANIIGRWIDRFGNMPVLITGQLLLVVSALMLSFLATYSPVFILLAYLFMSPGFSALTSSVSNEVTRILPVEKIGSGMGLTQLIQFISGGFGVTITGLYLSVQESLPLELVYRHIFLALSILVLLSIGLYFHYIRRGKGQS